MCPQCGGAPLRHDRMGDYCPKCKYQIMDWRAATTPGVLAAECARLRAENALLRDTLHAVAQGATLYDESIFPIYGRHLQDLEAEPTGRRWVCAACKRWVTSTSDGTLYGLAQASADIMHTRDCVVTKVRVLLNANSSGNTTDSTHPD